MTAVPSQPRRPSAELERGARGLATAWPAGNGEKKLPQRHKGGKPRSASHKPSETSHSTTENPHPNAHMKATAQREGPDFRFSHFLRTCLAAVQLRRDTVPEQPCALDLLGRTVEQPYALAAPVLDKCAVQPVLWRCTSATKSNHLDELFDTSRRREDNPYGTQYLLGLILSRRPGPLLESWSPPRPWNDEFFHQLLHWTLRCSTYLRLSLVKGSVPNWSCQNRYSNTDSRAFCDKYHNANRVRKTGTCTSTCTDQWQLRSKTTSSPSRWNLIRTSSFITAPVRLKCSIVLTCQASVHATVDGVYGQCVHVWKRALEPLVTWKLPWCGMAPPFWSSNRATLSSPSEVQDWNLFRSLENFHSK